MSIERELGSLHAKVDSLLSSADLIFSKVNRIDGRTEAHTVRIGELERRATVLESCQSDLKRWRWLLAGGICTLVVVVGWAIAIFL